MQRSGELWTQSNAASLSIGDKEAANKVFNDYNLMPQFFIDIMPLQAQFGCAGAINARLLVYFEENAHIVPTKTVLFAPMVEIWSEMYGFVGPQQTFSNQTINIVEQIIKKLVNDWSASQ